MAAADILELLMKAARKPKAFTPEERAAMRERAQELRSQGGDAEVLARIAEMQPSDRAMAERLHALVKAVAPSVEPRTWYGMPAYALGGNVVCFFQSAQKFKTRYATLGFSDKAKLDEGAMWPTSFALKELTGAEEAGVRALLKKALGAI
ncbi:MAG: iron chaperone [Terriglobales bacterium]